MHKTIGILAHVDAGKTTFAEQILYHTKSIKIRGRVDHKNSFLDNHKIEKERGITVFSEQGTFNYKDSTYYLIDTPGHMDFSSEMERAIQVMDYAVIIISGVEGIQGHTETVWNLLRKHNIPVLFFINKIDRVGANDENVIEDIKLNFTKKVCFIDKILNSDELSPELIEFIAEQDEYLLEKYLEDNYEKDLWLKSMKKLIKKSELFPCFIGSALQNIGIEDFLENLHVLTYTEYNEEEKFSGRVYKIRYDEQNNRLTYIKALSGSLKVKEEITLPNIENDFCEKVNEIRIYNGDKYINVDKAEAGQIFAVTGLSSANVGDGIGTLKDKATYNMVPTLKSKVIFDESLNVKDVLRYFKILESEDPSLNIIWDEKFQEIQVYIMGVIQLEVLKNLMEERFNISIDFGPCEILYKETILDTVIGYGHFEPLKHYSEVHLKLELGERNTGITFESLCHTDDLTTGNQNLVKTHIFERDHHGILTGSPITDLKITLLTGRAHNKHTSGGDFREATFRALRQGLEKAKNLLLEPYYSFKMEVPLDYMGRVLSDIQKLKGDFNPPETIHNKAIIKGRGPVATFMNYSVEFISFTKGKGKFNFVFDGYDICHNEKEVIEKISYDKNADIEYTSTSIFCSKGQAFLVKYNEAEEYMHCLK
ncbi:TetM/TetW/TetO/TetS family tetracycline resistance ribosomal protection protein [Clostridium sporogenes]|uniref:TetM/TetW/TetO/TetS family tetracycline resistance ribosomal protection protein n=1 Tax=Clostridium sporogenes TaxID=1509 RepID=A0A7X5SWM4_CLOSG|nr:TetM/TetW/TetO/TetS family tetracycline resistance ribosomal protection protein [Clostridium sporogenes]AJD29811.1 small GTP-binding domain protein [Clostridium botulinum Prevot_594]NFQ16278.1 TetM/TetW/TetO/TetS family tetracycline resistance ribosomal protection protein [Clostridium sporogenes]NFQ20303.1 TetM/TetW/TetO/TetS family tetracycline resistance ribosomal protection protein [Clostridium sporogenes]NFQ27289.1 TetM/TetW/TetO/TetS family tetracycline resistance ribosomal protection p